MKKLLGAVWVLTAATVGSMHAETVSLTATADTTLFENNPNNNLGGEASLAVGTTAKGLKCRGLIQFDLSQIPPGASITSVSLRFRVTKTPSFGANNSNFELRRALVSWGEGSKRGNTGATGGAGEATWEARSGPADLWSAPGGAEGTDFAAPVSSTVAVAGVGTYTFPSSPALIEDVRFWLEQPSKNFGWLVRSDAEDTSATARRVASSEASPQQAPTLVVEFSPGAAPLQITGIVVSGTQGTVTWSGGTPPFQVQVKENVADSSWTNLGPSLQTGSFTFDVERAQSFFRVVSGGN